MVPTLIFQLLSASWNWSGNPACGVNMEAYYAALQLGVDSPKDGEDIRIKDHQTLEDENEWLVLFCRLLGVLGTTQFLPPGLRNSCCGLACRWVLWWLDRKPASSNPDHGVYIEHGFGCHVASGEPCLSVYFRTGKWALEYNDKVGSKGYLDNTRERLVETQS